MEKFVRENTIKSFFGNLVANAVISSVVLWNTSVVLLKDENLTSIKNVIPPVFFSIIVTSLITFFTLTIARKKGEISLPINPNASWFMGAMINGILIGFCFALITLGIIVLCQNAITNLKIPKPTFVFISALFIAIIASIASIILANRAAKII